MSNSDNFIPKQQYWEKYYNIKKSLDTPSSFCNYITKNYDLRDFSITDICCGNGRDTFHLGTFCKNVIGIDYANKPNDRENIKFVRSSIEDYIAKNKNLITYCRFGFHAFEESIENIIIENSKVLMLEFRSDKDTSFVNDHYRRLINGNKFISKLLKTNYNIHYFKHGTNMAIYKQYNPMIIRVVASQLEFKFNENI